MEIILRDLIANGFVIRPQGEQWLVEKLPLPDSSWRLEPVTCTNYEEAVCLASQMLQDKKNETPLLEWTATVRYNRGLGVEYRNLQPIQASTAEEAKEKALCEAQKLLSGERVLDIREVRVRPKQ